MDRRTAGTVIAVVALVGIAILAGLTLATKIEKLEAQQTTISGPRQTTGVEFYLGDKLIGTAPRFSFHPGMPGTPSILFACSDDGVPAGKIRCSGIADTAYLASRYAVQSAETHSCTTAGPQLPGTVNDFTCSLLPTPQTLSPGMGIYARFHRANTGPATFEVNATGRKEIWRNGVQLSANELAINRWRILIFNPSLGAAGVYEIFP